MTASNTDFKELFFEHKLIPRIEGEPTFTSLHNLLRLLKANTCSVPCTLGGGNHGYVGMLISATSYHILAPGTPFIAPTHPGPLAVVPGATQYQIALAKSQHEETMRVFRDYCLMQRALIQQLITAIEPKYLASMRNRITGQLPSDVRAIFLQLFRVYGKIKPEHIMNEKNKVETFSFNISEPIDDVFNRIDDLAELAELAERPFTDKQLTDFGFIIFNRQRAFRDDVRSWLKRPIEEHTYVDLRAHFTDAHVELRAIDATTDELGYHSVNAVVENIVERLLQVQNEAEPPPAFEPLPPHVPAPPIEVANAVAHQPANDGFAQMQMQILALQQQNQDMMAQLFARNQFGRGRGRGGRPHGRGGRAHGRGGRGNRRGQYCWTHGNCAHNGQECETPAEGHIATATFANKQNGSTRGCTQN